MGTETGTYVVTIEDVADSDRAIARRFEGTDEAVEELALRLESMVEQGWIEGYSIKGRALPPLATVEDIYTAIITLFWGYGISDTILGPSGPRKTRNAWDSGWRNRDYYFTRNAKANIR